MIANYGYEDGTGFYYISVDTEKCAECGPKECVAACAQGVLVAEEDDWGDEVVAVGGEKALALHSLCTACKQDADAGEPCRNLCPFDALVFSW